MYDAIKLTKNADPDKYSYTAHCVEFNARGSFSFSDGTGFGKNVILRADMSSSLHIDKKGRYHDSW